MDAITQIPHPSNETPRDYRPNSPGRADSEVALNALSLDHWTCSDDDLDGVLGVFRARVSGSGVVDLLVWASVSVVIPAEAFWAWVDGSGCVRLSMLGVEHVVSELFFIVGGGGDGLVGAGWGGLGVGRGGWGR